MFSKTNIDREGLKAVPVVPSPRAGRRFRGISHDEFVSAVTIFLGSGAENYDRIRLFLFDSGSSLLCCMQMHRLPSGRVPFLGFMHSNGGRLRTKYYGGVQIDGVSLLDWTALGTPHDQTLDVLNEAERMIKTWRSGSWQFAVTHQTLLDFKECDGRKLLFELARQKTLSLRQLVRCEQGWKAGNKTGWDFYSVVHNQILEGPVDQQPDRLDKLRRMILKHREEVKC